MRGVAMRCHRHAERAGLHSAGSINVGLGNEYELLV